MKRRRPTDTDKRPQLWIVTTASSAAAPLRHEKYGAVNPAMYDFIQAYGDDNEATESRTQLDAA